MWAAVWAAACHSLFLVIKSFLVSLSVLHHNDFHWKIRAGDSGKLRGVPGSNWYAFSSLRTCQKRMDVISFLWNRTSQRQDRPQSDNRGGPGWEQLHLDTNHSQLEVDKHLQRGSGMWTGDHEGHQIQGKPTTTWNAQQTFLMSEGFQCSRGSAIVFTTCRLQFLWIMEGSQYSFLSTISQQRSLGTSW